MRAFCRRNKIEFYKSTKTDIKRALKADRDIFTQFYALVRRVLDREGIDINRSDLGTIFYNADEVGADPEGKLLPKAAMKGLIRKQRRQTVASGDHAPFHATVMLTTRGDGMAIVSPLVIHVGKRARESLVEYIPSNWGFQYNGHGGQTAATFTTCVLVFFGDAYRRNHALCFFSWMDTPAVFQ